MVYDALNPIEGVPNPGSHDAMAAGCLCPVDDNDGGALVGGMGFYLMMNCPLHGEARLPDRPAAESAESADSKPPPAPLKPPRPQIPFKGWRDRFVRQARPHLSPGEVIDEVLIMRRRSGANLVLPPIYAVFVTDRDLVVFEAEWRGLKLTGPPRRFPISTGLQVRFGLPFGRGRIGDEEVRIHPRFVRAARRVGAR